MRRGSHVQRVAIRLGSGYFGRSQRGAGALLVHGNDRLPKLFGQVGCEQAGDNVGGSACGIGYKKIDGLGGVSLRHSATCKGGTAQAGRGQECIEFHVTSLLFLADRIPKMPRRPIVFSSEERRVGKECVSTCS